MNDCIEHNQKSRYGMTMQNGKPITMHRKAWIEANGPVPKGLEVCHRCNNPKCFNPEHLYVATHAQNIQDAYNDGLISRRVGEEHPKAKLTNNDVVAIRADTRPNSAIAKEYGVTKSTVGRIKRKTIWRHI